MVGQEEPFPVADNQSKLKRSCENAEHVGKFRTFFSPTSHLTSAGLFAPAVGQHYRHEQRYRNSQFDRGTSMAIREREYDDTFDGDYIGVNSGFHEGGGSFPSRGGRGGYRGRGSYGHHSYPSGGAGNSSFGKYFLDVLIVITVSDFHAGY